MSAGSEPLYWSETRRPLVNLAFVAPLLVLYELGVWWTTSEVGPVRNGADEWLRAWLSSWEWTRGWLLPFLMAAVFLLWHAALRDSRRVRFEVLAGMLAESLLCACLLILIGQAADGLMRSEDHFPLLSLSDPWVGIRLVHFLGAGLYEEFLFRLCLLPVAYLLLRVVLIPQRGSTWGAVIATSVLFALAHYLAPTSDATVLSVFSEAVTRVQSSRELWFGFAFRAIAGVMFGWLFVFRGFGIAVGCHAAYDIVVGIVLVSDL